MDLGRSGRGGEGQEPIESPEEAIWWVRDVGIGWESAGACTLSVEQGGQELERSRSGGVGNDRISFRAPRRGLVKWASGIR